MNRTYALQTEKAPSHLHLESWIQNKMQETRCRNTLNPWNQLRKSYNVTWNLLSKFQLVFSTFGRGCTPDPMSLGYNPSGTEVKGIFWNLLKAATNFANFLNSLAKRDPDPIGAIQRVFSWGDINWFSTCFVNFWNRQIFIDHNVKNG